MLLVGEGVGVLLPWAGHGDGGVARGTRQGINLSGGQKARIQVRERRAGGQMRVAACGALERTRERPDAE